MARKKKVAELTTADRLYIELSLKTSNNINYDELFKRLSLQLDKDEVLIRDFANKLSPPVIDEQLPPEPTPKTLHPAQEIARNLMTPNRKDPNKARHVTVMSEAVSEIFDQQSPSAIKGSERTRSCIYRQ